MKPLVIFPDPNNADDDGLIAVGGELTPDYLLSAYVQGVFPWFGNEDPILWWSPNPRLVLYPEKFKVSSSLKQVVRSRKFEIRVDTVFNDIIENCSAVPRPGQDGTWITNEMKVAYKKLYRLGYCHSFETFFDGELVGGLYGLSLGKAFFGESMFFKMTNASKFALFHLVEFCQRYNFDFIDAQQPTEHLKSLGAEEIQRSLFLEKLKSALKHDTLVGKWNRMIG